MEGCESIEKLANAIIETIHEPLLIVLDPDLRISFANPSFFRHFKTTPEETVGRFLYDLGDRKWDLPDLKDPLRKVLPMNEAIVNFEVRQHFPFIGQRIMRINARRLEMEPSEPPLILVAIEDITERVLAQEALQKAHEELEQKVIDRTAELSRANDQLKREVEFRKQAEKSSKEYAEQIKLFSYSISHDLKNPALTINLLAKRMIKSLSKNLNEKDKAFWDQIVGTSEEMMLLLDKIHHYISVKEKRARIDRFQPTEIYSKLREEFARSLDSRGITWLQCECDSEISADKMAMLRALRNLVSNALEHGGKELSVIEVGCADSEAYNILFVRDNGVGLKKEVEQEIFEPFKQSDIFHQAKGIGLGLSIVKETANMHGGDAWFEPGREKGVTFYFSIRKGIE
jgi:signal transduction histidine kinase